MSSKNKGDVKKQSDIVQQIKESQTLDKKHKEMVNLFNNNKIKKENIEKEIEEIKTKLIDLPNHYENMILQNRNILADQMDYLVTGLPKNSRVLQSLATH